MWFHKVTSTDNPKLAVLLKWWSLWSPRTLNGCSFNANVWLDLTHSLACLITCCVGSLNRSELTRADSLTRLRLAQHSFITYHQGLFRFHLNLIVYLVFYVTSRLPCGWNIQPLSWWHADVLMEQQDWVILPIKPVLTW